MKANEQEAARILGDFWKMEPAIVAKANQNRSYAVGAVTREKLAEQRNIATTFFSEGLIPKNVDTSDVTIFDPA